MSGGTDPSASRALFEAAKGASFRAEIPEQWSQGRTSYGGLLSALAQNAARAVVPADAIPRAAQISFIAPSVGTLSFEAALLRGGRSASFASVTIHAQESLVLTSTFIFGAPRSSGIKLTSRQLVDLPPPEQCKPIFRNNPHLPKLTQNFDYRSARGATPNAAPGFTAWLRLIEPVPLDPFAMLLLLADALPPAAITLASAPGNASSMNWSVNFTHSAPSTRDGWWLVQTSAQDAAEGFGSQSMLIANADGVVMAESMQAMALFF